MRATFHYFFAALTLSIYGGQVCPFIDSLSFIDWMIEMALIFGGAFLLRQPLWRRFVFSVPLEERLPRAIRTEWGIFITAGIVITIFDLFAYQFPIGSGIKIVVACVGLGLFAAIDMELAEERRLYNELTSSGGSIPSTDRYMPLTSRFTIATIVVVTVATAAVTLVVVRDMEWLGGLSAEEVLASRWAVAAEIVFVAVIALAHMINLTLSLSKNLNLFFGAENRVLASAMAGDLDSRVTVVRNNEFGMMGRYTNDMIESLKKRTDELQVTRDVTIHALASLAETRDNETGAHILRTQRYVRALAEELRKNHRYAAQLDDETVDLLFKSAPLHDIGKVGIPDAILLKPGKLTDDEFTIMKTHTILGKEALDRAEPIDGGASFLKLAREIAIGHHEKWNGAGYPYSLAGEAIPLSARLMAVADVYDALMSKRVYKPAFTHEAATAIIREGRGSHFDPTIVDAFFAIEEKIVAIYEKYAETAKATA